MQDFWRWEWCFPGVLPSPLGGCLRPRPQADEGQRFHYCPYMGGRSKSAPHQSPSVTASPLRGSQRSQIHRPRRSPATAPPHRRAPGGRVDEVQRTSFISRALASPVRPAVFWCPCTNPRPAALAGRAGRRRRNHPGRAFPDVLCHGKAVRSAAQKLQPLPHRLIHIVGDQMQQESAAPRQPRARAAVPEADRPNRSAFSMTMTVALGIDADLDDSGRDQRINSPCLESA